MTHIFDSEKIAPDKVVDADSDCEDIAPDTVVNVSRRFILKGIVGTGTFVVGASLLPDGARAAWWVTGHLPGALPGELVAHPHVFVAIDPSGEVTIIANRTEMGTGIKTSLPMVVADEMEADWSRVHVQQAPGDNEKYGNEDTDGSRSVRRFVNPMRQIGASMRMMLEEAAAKQWNVDPSTVHAKFHEVYGPSGQKIGFGELAAAANALPAPPRWKIRLKEPSQFRYIGKGKVKIVDLYDITVGRAIYGIDVRLPGMKCAVIERPPVDGGSLVSYDASEALKVPGVEKVVEIKGWPWPSGYQPLGGVAVVARNTGVALKGREKLKIVWNEGPNIVYDTDTYRKLMAETAAKTGTIIREDGNFEKGFKSAVKKISAEYYIPHIAHVPMEPEAATAHFADGKCVVWAPTQYPGDCRNTLAKTLGIPKENITVNVTLLGGSFGRKCIYDFVQEAALLSREIGAPVKVTWSRPDDIHHDCFNITAVERIDAGLDANGRVVAWRHNSTGSTILGTFKKGAEGEFNIEQGLGLIDCPFYIPNLRLEVGKVPVYHRIGWFRSVTNIPHAFAMQSMVGEIAAAVGRDPKEVLQEIIGPSRVVNILGSKHVHGAAVDGVSKKGWWDYGDPPSTYPVDTSRLQWAVDTVAEMAGWGKKLPEGEGLGIAAHRSFQSYVATVVHARVDKKGHVSVPAVYYAVDCGFYINPERIRSQFEGGAVQGFALAAISNITFKNGRPQQSNFNDMHLPRINESPLNVHIQIRPADQNNPSCGIGEVSVPTFAPALTNAIFAATGKRIRSLPIGSQLAA
jgi:isoquinoline 1-oxidoreductase beta subunit